MINPSIPSGDSPLDVVEEYFEAREWEAERISDHSIATGFCDTIASYSFMAGWCEPAGELRFIISWEINGGFEQSALDEALRLVNERIWDGVFGYSSDEGHLTFRFVLHSYAAIDDEIVETLISNALKAINNFSVVFQAVVTGVDVKDAINMVIIQTEGTA